MMHHCLLCLFVLFLTGIRVQSQPASSPANAVDVLSKTKEKLDRLSVVRYRQTRETKYYGDNYYSLFSAELFIQRIKNSPIGWRLQASEGNTLFIYDGQQTIRLKRDAMTIDSASAKNARQLEGNSYLSHSLINLGYFLPLVIGDDSTQKSISDTLIGGQSLYCVKMERPNRYYDGFYSMQPINLRNLRRPYYLLIDKKTYLPYQFITRYIRGNDDRDYITVTFDDLNMAPALPADSSWAYISYRDKYQPFKPKEKKPVIKTGVIIGDFTLPDYRPAAIDSASLHQYTGKVVLLDFWFKSCGPCMAAMPHYNTLQNKYGKDGFQLLTINVEDGEEDMKFFYNKYQPAYKMLFKGNVLFEKLGLSACPSSVLLDRSGKVTEVFAGFDEPVISRKIGELLAQ
ncbi:TlpA family protein disulfide reductase [Paraflavitalea soli]|nr:TlpA disulfide reductase family protein [Paraflavitalea soli]